MILEVPGSAQDPPATVPPEALPSAETERMEAADRFVQGYSMHIRYDVRQAFLAGYDAAGRSRGQALPDACGGVELHPLSFPTGAVEESTG